MTISILDYWHPMVIVIVIGNDHFPRRTQCTFNDNFSAWNSDDYKRVGLLHNVLQHLQQQLGQIFVKNLMFQYQ